MVTTTSLGELSNCSIALWSVAGKSSVQLHYYTLEMQLIDDIREKKTNRL